MHKGTSVKREHPKRTSERGQHSDYASIYGNETEWVDWWFKHPPTGQRQPRAADRTARSYDGMKETRALTENRLEQTGHACAVCIPRTFPSQPRKEQSRDRGNSERRPMQKHDGRVGSRSRCAPDRHQLISQMVHGVDLTGAETSQ
jgi:hypothetical protein